MTTSKDNHARNGPEFKVQVQNIITKDSSNDIYFGTSDNRKMQRNLTTSLSIRFVRKARIKKKPCRKFLIYDHHFQRQPILVPLSLALCLLLAFPQPNISIVSVC